MNRKALSAYMAKLGKKRWENTSKEQHAEVSRRGGIAKAKRRAMALCDTVESEKPASGWQESGQP